MQLALGDHVFDVSRRALVLAWLPAARRDADLVRRAEAALAQGADAVDLGVLGEDALPIGVAIVGSWFLGLVVVGWSAAALERLLGRPRDDLPRAAA